MVVTKEQLAHEAARGHDGLLVDRVERDMAEVLSEHGSADDGKRQARTFSFGYGIPMAGVRYYSFLPEE